MITEEEALDYVGKEVYFISGIEIWCQILSMVTITKAQGNGNSQHTNVKFSCGANTPSFVFKTKLNCAKYWMKNNGIEVSLSEVK